MRPCRVRSLCFGSAPTSLRLAFRDGAGWIEFDSYEQALACYHSPGYQAALALRAPVSVADVVVVEGYEGPQP